MQVQKTVNDVPGQFPANRLAVLYRGSRGRRRADHDLSVRESDDIRGSGYLKKIPVHPCDGSVRNHRDFYDRQFPQHGGRPSWIWLTSLSRQQRQRFQSFE